MERQISECFESLLTNGIRGVDEEFESIEHRFLNIARSIADEEEIVSMTGHQDGNALSGVMPRIKTLLGASSIGVFNLEGTMLAGGNFNVPSERKKDMYKDILAHVLKGKDVAAIMKSEKGVGFTAFTQIRAKEKPVGVLMVFRLLDYDLLVKMKAAFGIDIIVYNGALPQVTTITKSSVFTDPNLKAVIAEVNTRQRQITKEMKLGGLDYYAAVKPIKYEMEQIGVMVVAASGDKTYRERMILKIAALPSIAFLLLIAFYISRRVSLKIVGPIKQLCNVTREISEGSLSVIVDIKSGDEVGVLADSFNRMINEIRKHEDNLNELVEEKTSELTTTNAELLNEMIERKRVQAQKDLSMNLLQNIADNVPGAIYQFKLNLDGSCCFPYASAAFYDIYRIHPEEVREDASVVFTRLYPDYYYGFNSSIRKSVTDWKRWQHEGRLVLGDGTIRWVLGGAMPKQEPDGSVTWQGFVMDVTERKLIEEQLVELNRTLGQRVKDGINEIVYQKQLLVQQSKMAAMGEMLGLIAHQWRQPLNAIGLNVQDLKDAYDFGELDARAIDNIVDVTMNQVNFMSKTIDDFRNFFKPSKTKQRFDVKKNIEEIISMFSHVFNKNNVDVSIMAADEILLFTEGYPNEFKQVVLNILNNAKDAIVSNRDNAAPPPQKRGKIEITIGNNEGRDKVIIKIRDSGGGIPETIIGKILEPYYTTKGKEGTGLGLHMSKTIVETNMGGTLSVRNIMEAPEGAEFTITLAVTGGGDEFTG
ncbi:MAG: HAMP domain-containing protein [Nitrospirae bacterium]|nr:HAMP domain-containing protein [Nitrospirota bacterium]